MAEGKPGRASRPATTAQAFQRAMGGVTKPTKAPAMRGSRIGTREFSNLATPSQALNARKR
jgi:hypothetical protein